MLIYQGQVLKQKYQPDFVCYDKIIVEIKAISRLSPENFAQVTNYLKATEYQLGLLFNFGHFPLLQQERIPNIKISKAFVKTQKLSVYSVISVCSVIFP
jgi:GxxExxY protein